MSPVTINTRPWNPALQTAAQIPAYLEWFFSSGRTRTAHPVSITSGLWTLLRHCWSLSPAQMDASALCRHLLLEPGYGWREEGDVLEAMSRAAGKGNPSHLAPSQVAGFLAAVMAEGEVGRGKAQSLRLGLEFVLPRLDQHPIFRQRDIEVTLRRSGMSEDRIRYHREAVHPEIQPYLGTWELAFGDRCELSPSPATTGRTVIPIAAPACGLRSQVALSLSHHEELCPYFQMSLGESAPSA
jgi:hypothetical protein